jgi:hypothetical protein
MNPFLHAALLVLCALAYGRGMWALGNAIGPVPLNQITSKNKVISTVTGISATTVDCDETAGFYEVPRGARNVSITYLSTLNTGFSTGATFFKGHLVGCDTPGGTFTRINGFSSAELVVDVAQELPAADDAEGISLPRFLKVEWAETGAMTSFTGTARIRYDLPGGPGRQHVPEYVGG